jgi:hypothetical protein
VVDDHALARVVDEHRRQRGRTARHAAQQAAVDPVAAQFARDLVGGGVIADPRHEARRAAQARDRHGRRRRRSAADAREARGAELRVARGQLRQAEHMVLHGMAEAEHGLGARVRHDKVTA